MIPLLSCIHHHCIIACTHSLSLLLPVLCHRLYVPFIITWTRCLSLPVCIFFSPSFLFLVITCVNRSSSPKHVPNHRLKIYQIITCMHTSWSLVLTIICVHTSILPGRSPHQCLHTYIISACVYPSSLPAHIPHHRMSVHLIITRVYMPSLPDCTSHQSLHVEIEITSTYNLSTPVHTSSLCSYSPHQRLQIHLIIVCMHLSSSPALHIITACMHTTSLLACTPYHCLHLHLIIACM